MSQEHTRLLAIGLLVLALAFVGWCGWRAWSLQERVRATATVVRFDVVSPPGKNSTRYIVAAFEVEGQRQEHRLQNAMNSPFSYQEGDEVEVLFVAGQPETALLNRFGELYGPALLFAGVLSGFGFVLLLAGAPQPSTHR